MGDYDDDGAELNLNEEEIEDDGQEQQTEDAATEDAEDELVAVGSIRSFVGSHGHMREICHHRSGRGAAELAQEARDRQGRAGEAAAARQAKKGAARGPAAGELGPGAGRGASSSLARLRRRAQRATIDSLPTQASQARNRLQFLLKQAEIFQHFAPSKEEKAKG